MNRPVAIEAVGLEKSYGRTRALAGLDLGAPSGSILCVLGPNGSGKTTAVRILTTLLHPDRGTARVAGHDVVSEAAKVRRSIGLVGQSTALDECLTGRSNLVMVGQLRRLSRRAAQRRADELLDRFDLADAGGRGVKTYSGGMRRRLDLSSSLMVPPAVLFLDEPTTGLDPRSRLAVWAVIRRMATDGLTVLLTTQYLDEADQLADRIAVVDGGRVIAEGTSSQLKARVGGERIEITVAPGSDLAIARDVLASHVDAAVQVDDERRTVEAPLEGAARLLPRIVAQLESADVMLDDLGIHRPSLDDVFLALTGHVASASSDDPKDENDPI